MKLIIILGIEDLQDKLYNALKEVRLQAFSKMDILGHVVDEKADLAKWFANELDAMYSVAVFTFINNEETAEKLMEQIRMLNRSSSVNYPFHAYQIDVEKSLG